MNYSGYQIESVLRQLRRLRGLLLARREPTVGDDPVHLSESARSQAQTVRLVTAEDAPPPGRTVREIYDETRHAPRVERELERRARSFLDPSHPPEPAGPPIAKLRKRKR
jgi:hypothetical protein